MHRVVNRIEATNQIVIRKKYLKLDLLQYLENSVSETSCKEICTNIEGKNQQNSHICI